MSNMIVANVWSGVGRNFGATGIGCVVRVMRRSIGNATNTWFRNEIIAIRKYAFPLTRTKGCVLYLNSHCGHPVKSGIAKTAAHSQKNTDVMANVPHRFMLYAPYLSSRYWYNRWLVVEELKDINEAIISAVAPNEVNALLTRDEPR